MFKKKIAGLLAAMMCVSLIGCGGGGDKPADETKGGNRRNRQYFR